MVWLGALALVFLVAIGAAVAAFRTGRGHGTASGASQPLRRPEPAGPALAGPSSQSVGDRLRDAVARQRERASRLVAGHVQLIDVGAMVEGAAASGLSPAKALAVAEEVARRMVGGADILVRIEPDGLAILFDGLDRGQAEARSRRIAEATVEALGEVGAGGRYLAEGFGYELDDVMDGAVIDTVEDLVRFVHIAHRAYVSKQRGIARQLEQGIVLVSRTIVAAAGGAIEGHEIAVFRRSGEGERSSLREDSFVAAEPAVGAETDCVVLEKLPEATAAFLGSGTVPYYAPVRLSSLVNPLYFDNLRAALDACPAALRQRLVLVIDPGTGPVRKFLHRAPELLRSRVASVAVRAVDPAVDVPAAAAAGVAIVVLDAPDRRFGNPAEVVARFDSLAKDSGLSPIVFGAGQSIAELPGGIPHSSGGPG